MHGIWDDEARRGDEYTRLQNSAVQVYRFVWVRHGSALVLLSLLDGRPVTYMYVSTVGYMPDHRILVRHDVYRRQIEPADPHQAPESAARHINYV